MKTPEFEVLPLEVYWTRHAKERAEQRFAFDNSFVLPRRTIQKVGSKQPVGKEFKVRRGKMLFACKRTTTGIIILTVLHARER